MNKKQILSEILKRADELVKADVDVSPVEHQMHTRLYNNSFCNLIKEGVYARVNEETNCITLIINKQQYTCPKNIAETILRVEYEPAMEKCLKIENDIIETTTENINKVFGITHLNSLDISADDFLLPEVFDRQIDVSISMDEETADKVIAVADTDISYEPQGSTGNGKILEFRPKSVFTGIVQPQDQYKEDDEADNSLSEFIPGRAIVTPEDVNEQIDKEDRDKLDEPVFKPKDEVNANEGKSEEEDEPHGFFSRSRRAKKAKDVSFVKTSAEIPKSHRGFLLGKHRRELSEETIPPQTSTKENSDPAETAFKPKTTIINVTDKPEEIPDTPYEAPGTIVYEKPKKADHTQDCGELFVHRHQITLCKSYGNEQIGPFRFTFWPINVPRHSERQFADMLVHVIDDTAKTEQLFICDSRNPELSLTFDKKAVKIFGIWEDGKFDSHITLQGQTASMFRINDDVERIEPETISDSFFDQFRFEKKGQPKHFIVPFSTGNHGEENIPIVGYVEIRSQKYPLKRMEGNTVQYKLENKQRIITGHWEDDRFSFKIDNMAGH